jgi:hypothetical protein
VVGISTLSCLHVNRGCDTDLGSCRALDALHLALVAHVVYHYAITNFGRLTITLVWSFKVFYQEKTLNNYTDR